MPPRKEPKEIVFYPPSKQKAPPFKPLRPSTIPRTSTTDSESAAPKRTTKPPPPKRRKVLPNDDDDEESDADKGASENDSDDSEDLPANPLTAKRAPTSKKPTPKCKPAQSTRRQSHTSISSKEDDATAPAEPDPPPEPSRSDRTPQIPQALLVRLLHEAFADKDTKIDKQAIQVLQKYFEVFVRETIARALQRKREDTEAAGGLDAGDGADVGWLELKDLEKVAAGMMLDF